MKEDTIAYIQAATILAILPIFFFILPRVLYKDDFFFTRHINECMDLGYSEQQCRNYIFNSFPYVKEAKDIK